MRRSRFLPLAGLGLTLALVLFGPAARADITYHFVNYPDRQNGYTVSGTITTDGSTGTLTDTSFIKSWSFSLTGGPSGDFSTSSTQLAQQAILYSWDGLGSGQLVVTSTSISLGEFSRFELGFSLYPFISGIGELRWYRSDASGQTGGDVFYSGDGDGNYLWNSLHVGGFLPAGSPIATALDTSSPPAVPEPSSLAVAACGGLAGLIALARRRRR